MFSNNTERDDIAILMNLISQMNDEKDEFMASVMGDNRIEYGVDDVMKYIRRKYGDNY